LRGERDFGEGQTQEFWATNEHESEMLGKAVESIVGAAYEVSNVPGLGFWRRFMNGLRREDSVRGH